MVPPWSLIASASASIGSNSSGPMAPDGAPDAGECDESHEGVSEVLVVLGQTSVSAEPRKGPFDNPAARQDDEP